MFPCTLSGILYYDHVDFWEESKRYVRGEFSAIGL